MGISAGSTDNSEALFREHLLGTGATVATCHKTGFGTAVKLGLAQRAGSRSRRGDRAYATASVGPNRGSTAAAADDDAAQEWLWLLHDDSAPHPAALAELLFAVERAPSVTVAGCKQLDAAQPRKLLDVGLSTSGWAERLSLIDVDELDQGQYDGRSDVFAVNSAGMLVRRDVWDALGGFDPALPGAGDDIDFCWRNRLAGHRVVVVPSAKMFHVVDRPHSMAQAKSARRGEVYLRLKHAPLWKLPFLAAGALLGAVFQFLLSVIAKDPAYGARQLFATLGVLLRPILLVKGRRRAGRSRRRPRTVIHSLQTPRRDVWAHRRSRLEALDAEDVVGDGAGGDDSAQVPTGDSADDFVSLAAPARGWAGAGGVGAVLILAGISFAGLHRLFGADAVAGGALLPLSGTMSEIWRNASAWWAALGAGYPGHGDPFDYVLWLIAAVGFGDGSLAVVWLILLAMPLAGLGAWAAVGALTQRRWVRFWAALVWASIPAFQVALGSGRLGALLAHLLIPWVVLGMLRAVGAAAKRRPNLAAGSWSQADPFGKPGSNGRPSWTAAAATGLTLAALTAAAPILLPIAVVGVGAVSLFAGRRGKTLWWSLLPAAALFVPYIASTVGRPRAFIADPGVPMAFVDAPLWQQLLGYPVMLDLDAGLRAVPGLGAWLPAPWALIAVLLVGMPLVLLAASALFTAGRRAALVRALWLLALLTLAAGYCYSQIAVAAGAGALVPPFSGPVVSLALFLLLGAAVLGANRLFEPRRAPDGAPLRGAQFAAAAVALVMLLGPLTSLGLWAVPNATGSASTAAGTASGDGEAGTTMLGARTLIAPSAPRTLPATATDRGNGPQRGRTLVLNADDDGAITAALMRGGGTTLDQLSGIVAAWPVSGQPGAESVAPPDEAEAQVRQAVAIIAAGSGVDPRPQLEQLGVGFVVLQESNTAAELLASRVDGVPGLAAVGQTDSGWLWRVRAPAAGEEAAGGAAGAAADGAAENAAYRVWILDGNGNRVSGVPAEARNVQAPVPDGANDRLLVLAERADQHWSAWVDGRRLTATTAGWSQAFTLPAQGGELVVRYEHPWAGWWAAGQIIVIGLTVLLAVPLPAKRRNSIRRRVGAQLDRAGERGGANVRA